MFKSGKGAGLLVAKKEFCQLLTQSIMEPSKYGFSIKTTIENSQFVSCYVDLLRSLKDSWTEYYSKLELYFSEVYQKNELFSPVKLLKGISVGKPNMVAVNAYVNLTKNKVLSSAVDAEDLLDILFNSLPERMSDLKKISPEIKKNLEVIVRLIFAQDSEDVSRKLVDLILSEKEQHRWFLHTFSTTFHKTILLNLETLFRAYVLKADEQIFPLIDMFVRVLAENKEPQSVATLISLVLEYWTTLRGNPNSRTDVLRTVHLLRSLSRLSDLKNENSDKFVSWYCNLLRSPTMELKVKFKCLQVLSLILQMQFGDQLKEALQCLSSLHFPITSQEIPPNSTEYNLYKSIFRQFLKTLETSRSPTLLYFIISIACREKRHICEDEIQSSLATLVSHSSSEQQLDLINVPFDIFNDETGMFSNQVKLAAVSKFVVPLVQSCLPQTVRRFFSTNLKTLLLSVSSLVNGNDERRTSILTKKIGTVQLLAVLYSKLDQNMVHSPGSILTSEAASILKKHELYNGKGDGKEMTGFLLKSLEESRRLLEPLDSTENMKSLYRQYHCARLNCCIAIVSCTSLTEKVYNHFIFKEAKAKDELIWSRIVDVNCDIQLKLVLEKDFFTRKHLVTVRQSSFSGPQENFSSQSHYLSDSSLSQDLSHYDYTASLTQSVTPGAVKDTKENVEPNNFVEIEEDEIGTNPCMAQLMAVIQHMAASEIYSIPTGTFTQVSLPLWMQSILAVLSDSSAHRNIKLLFLKLIYNCSEIFLPFCSKFYQPIIECIIDGTLSPAGELNYLILDLLTMMLYWSDKTNTLPDKNLAVSRMLTLLMKNVFHEQKRIFKANIELIRLILDKWLECCVLDANFSVIDELLMAEEGDGAHCGALKVLSVFLSNKYVDAGRLESLGLLKKVLQTYQSKSKEVYKVAGTATGLYLSSLKGNNEALEEAKTKVIKTLSDLSVHSTADKRQKFIIILHGIQESYPAILDDCASKFKYSLKNMVGEELSLCLEMLISHSTALIKDQALLPTELNMIGLKSFLQKNDPCNQILALKILKICHTYLDNARAKEYYDVCAEFLFSKYNEHRKLAFEIFENCYTYTEDELAKISCLEKIMNGLNDTNEEIKNNCIKFLDVNILHGNDSFERVKCILKSMHFKAHESALLFFLPVSILSLAENNVNYKRKLFLDPLDECQFVEYSVDTTWRMQHAASLMPMYADTLNSQSQGSLSQTPSAGMLRATVSTMEFSQTQGAMGSKNLSLANTNSHQSNLNLSLVRNVTNPSIKIGSLVAGRRFTKEQLTQGYQKSTFSKIAERQKARQRQLEEDKVKSTEKNVVLLRRYRKGDLPDIQISYSDLIAPIIKFCQHSKEMAHVLFSNVLMGIFEANSDIINDESYEEIATILNSVFRETVINSPDFLSPLLDLCIHLPSINSLDIRRLSEVCLSPALQHSGILLLEKYIGSKKENERGASNKKKKLTSNDQGNVELCIHLTGLYRSADEHENVNGVFNQNMIEMNVHEETSAALNFEGNGNWSEALKIYKKLLENPDLVENHLKQEVDIWHKGFYESHAKLGKWENLSASITKDFPNLAQTWEVSHRETVIKALMTSAMNLSDSNGKIYDFLNISLKDKEKASWLTKSCPLEISFLYSLRQRYTEGLKACGEGKNNQRMDIFSNNFLFTRSSTSQLLSLQGLCELEQYMLDLSVSSHSNDYSKFWFNNVPGDNSDLNQWDNILSVRSLYLRRASETVPMPSATKALGICYAQLGQSSVHQKNTYFAQRCLKKMKSFDGNDPSIANQRSAIISKVALVNYSTRSELTAVDNFCSVFKSLNNTNVITESSCILEINSQQRDTNECLFNIVDKNTHLTPAILRRSMKNERDLSIFDKKFGTIEDDHTALRNVLLDQVLENYSVLYSQAMSAQVGKLLFEGSSFSHHLWKENHKEQSFGELCLRYHLKSMEAGYPEARELFPRAMNIVTNQPESGKVFKDCSCTVPSWMFLPWKDQLISCVHCDDVGKYFAPLVHKLVQNYPNSVVYAIKSASRNPDLTDTACEIFQKLVAKLIFSPVHEKVITNMHYLVVPSVALNDLWKSLDSMKNSNSYWKLKAKDECIAFKERFISKEKAQGTMFQVFAKEFGQKLEKIFSSLNLDDLKKISKESAEWSKHRRSKYSMLKDYSPFLSEFLSSNYTDQIEVPGQYQGFSRPDPSRHIQIAGFDPGISIFTSIRMPFELRMLGSDGKRYRFVVKAGEDLRQDQRIENLFEICNSCLSHDVSCKNKDLRIKTYNVIPLGDNLGLIEFVPNTRPLKDFISLDAESTPALGKAEKHYVDGMINLTKEKNIEDAFQNSGNPSNEDIIRNYSIAVSQTEKTYLRKAILKLSSSPDGFYYLRKNFITSYAVLSVMQWILGKEYITLHCNL